MAARRSRQDITEGEGAARFKKRSKLCWKRLPIRQDGARTTSGSSTLRTLRRDLYGSPIDCHPVFVVTQMLKRVVGRYVVGGEKHGDLIAIAVGVIYCLITGTSYLSAQCMEFAVEWGVYVDQVFSGLIVVFIAGLERNVTKKVGLVGRKDS